jgi:hypothetical protein
MKRSTHGSFLSLALALLPFFGASAEKPPAPRHSAPSGQSSARRVPLFELHSSLLVNLHQTLFHEALLKQGRPDRRLQSTAPLSDANLTSDEKQAWNGAVAFYAQRFAGKQELRDDELVKINNLLSQAPDAASVPELSGLPQDVAAVLRTADPTYSKRWWPAHDKTNRDWIASMNPLIASMAPRIADAMQKDLQQGWPATPLRVDVSFFVPEIGHAYTTDDPPHTTFSSSAPALQGLNGFETLFHEASHAFADNMTNALFSDCAALKKDCGNLGHAVLFYTAGFETRRALPPAQQADFVPYAYKNGLYDRGEFPKYRRILEKSWQPYLDGKTDFQTALREMVAGL